MNVKHNWSLCFITLMLALPAKAEPNHVISVGGTITEIVYALHKEKSLVATDQSSIYPLEAQKLPQVGYYRQLSAEGILSLKPDLVLASSQAGPPKVLQQIQKTGVNVAYVNDTYSLESVYTRVDEVANALNAQEQAKTVKAQLKANMDNAMKLPHRALSTLFLMRRGGSVLAAGEHTAPNALMQFAGLKNSFEQFNGYKPLSKESLLSIDPEMLVVTRYSLQKTEDINDFLKSLGLQNSKAAKQGKVLILDDLLALSVGLRTPEAIKLLKDTSMKR